MRTTSTAKVEYVVYPPSTPTAKNGRIQREVGKEWSTTANSTPMRTHPLRFTRSVAHGQPPGEAGTASAILQRASAPSAPPSAASRYGIVCAPPVRSAPASGSMPGKGSHAGGQGQG